MKEKFSPHYGQDSKGYSNMAHFLRFMRRTLQKGAIVGAVSLRLLVCPGDDLIVMAGASGLVANTQERSAVLPPQEKLGFNNHKKRWKGPFISRVK